MTGHTFTRRTVAGTTRRTASPADPGERFSFDYAMKVDDAVVNAAVVDSFPPYIGSAVLLPGGAKKAEPAADAALGGQLSVASAAGVGYLVAYATPTTLTMVSIGRWAAASSGLACTTVGGAVNTGCSQFYQAGVGFSSRKAGLATVTDATVAATQSAVVVSVYSASGVTHYVSKKTGATQAGAGALAGDQLRVMDISSAGTFGLVGALSRVLIKHDALSTADINYTLDYYGALYGVSIGA